MNISRDDAIKAMDAITAAGFTADIQAAVIPKHSAEVLYRVSLPTLSFEDEDMRALCNLAESIGLVCKFQLGGFMFEYPNPIPRQVRKLI